jgi:hypothetical protein
MKNQNKYGVQSLSDEQKEMVRKICESESGATRMLFDEHKKPHHQRVKESEESLSHYEGFLYRTLKSTVSAMLNHRDDFPKKDIDKIMLEMEKTMCGLVVQKNFHKIKINEGDAYFEKYS